MKAVNHLRMLFAFTLAALAVQPAFADGQTYEQTLLDEIAVLEAVHAKRIDYCQGLARQQGPLALPAKAVREAGITKAGLEAAIGYFVYTNAYNCEQQTLLPLAYSLLSFHQQVKPSHPGHEKAKGLIELLVPSQKALSAKASYLALSESQKKMLEGELKGKLYSVTQITNFAELRKVLK